MQAVREAAAKPAPALLADYEQPQITPERRGLEASAVVRTAEAAAARLEAQRRGRQPKSIVKRILDLGRLGYFTSPSMLELARIARKSHAEIGAAARRRGVQLPSESDAASAKSVLAEMPKGSWEAIIRFRVDGALPTPEHVELDGFGSASRIRLLVANKQRRPRAHNEVVAVEFWIPIPDADLSNRFPDFRLMQINPPRYPELEAAWVLLDFLIAVLHVTGHSIEYDYARGDLGEPILLATRFTTPDGSSVVRRAGPAGSPVRARLDSVPWKPLDLPKKLPKQLWETAKDETAVLANRPSAIQAAWFRSAMLVVESAYPRPRVDHSSGPDESEERTLYPPEVLVPLKRLQEDGFAFPDSDLRTVADTLYALRGKVSHLKRSPKRYGMEIYDERWQNDIRLWLSSAKALAWEVLRGRGGELPASLGKRDKPSLQKLVAHYRHPSFVSDAGFRTAFRSHILGRILEDEDNITARDFLRECLRTDVDPTVLRVVVETAPDLLLEYLDQLEVGRSAVLDRALLHQLALHRHGTPFQVIEKLEELLEPPEQASLHALWNQLIKRLEQ